MSHSLFHDGLKKLRYASSFSRKKLVHTNLQLLYDCNFQCTICDFWKESFQQKNRLNKTEIDIIARKLSTIGPQIISVGGGEPLLHPELTDIIRILAREHFPVMICNGWFVTPQRARELFSAGIYEVSISVDYIDPDRHDRQRGRKGAFTKAVDALKVLHENRVHRYQRVHMISVLMEDNLEDIEPLILLCRDLGITYLLTLYSDCRGTKPKRSRGDGQDVTGYLLGLKKKYREFVALRGYLERFSEAIGGGGGGTAPCYAGRNLCNIDSAGNVSLCIDRLDSTVGNILEDDISLIEEKLQHFHRQNSCNRCWTSCRGSIETLMYGGNRLANLSDYYSMTRAVPWNSSHRKQL